MSLTLHSKVTFPPSTILTLSGCFTKFCCKFLPLTVMVVVSKREITAVTSELSILISLSCRLTSSHHSSLQCNSCESRDTTEDYRAVDNAAPPPSPLLPRQSHGQPPPVISRDLLGWRDPGVTRDNVVTLLSLSSLNIRSQEIAEFISGLRTGKEGVTFAGFEVNNEITERPGPPSGFRNQQGGQIITRERGHGSGAA